LAVTASAFILRFFHGYYPTEIARLAIRSRAAIDNWLSHARAEVSTAIAEPPDAREPRLDVVRARSHDGHGQSPHDHDEVVPDIQRALFAVRDGLVACGDVRTAYGASAPPVTSAVLRHLAHCARCLDAASAALGLPGLASRSASEHVDRSPRAPRGPRAGGGTGRGPVSLASFRQRVRDVVEHRPKELRVLANGFQLGVLHVTGARNELDLSAPLQEPIACVEVVSEQQIRLLWLEVTPPPTGDAEQIGEVTLGPNRTLDVVVRFTASWPTVHLVYVDPIEAGVTAQGADAIEDGIRVATRRDAVREPRRLRELRDALFASGDAIRATFSRRRLVAALAVVAIAALVLVGPSDVMAYAERIASAVWRIARSIVVERPRPVSVLPSRGIAIDLAAVPPAMSSWSIGSRSAPAISMPRLDRQALIGLEIDVLERLDRAGALLRDQLSVARSDTGVAVSAVVDRPERARELRQALGALVSVPELSVDIRSPHADRTVRSDRGRRTTMRVQDFELAETPGRARERVVEYVRRRGASPSDAATSSSASSTLPSTDTAEGTRQFVGEVLVSSARLVQEISTVRRVAARFAADDLQAIPADVFTPWRALLARHAEAAAVACRDLRQRLGPAFDRRDDVTRNAAHISSAPSITELRAFVDRLLSLAQTQDAQISAELAATSPEAAAVASELAEPAFWQRLDTIEHLADEIARAMLAPEF
jgi:hypothetical protein